MLKSEFMETKSEVKVATFSEVSCEVHGNDGWFDETNDEKDVKPEVCNKHSAVPHSISTGVDDVGREKNVTPRKHAKVPTIVSAIKGKNNDPSKKSRRVYFPEGGTIVAGFMDPPKPWNDAASCSTEDLVCAYQVACEKHGVKVIPKLLQQLQAINDFSDRNETLTLRGERLDQRHCETIEEILRRVQFRTIDLEATHLDVEGAVALFDMIEYYQSATRLNISYNRNMGPRGWQAFARMLKKSPCLEQMEARSCAISEQVMPMIGRSLRMGSLLTTLHLENSIMSGRHLMILVAAIKMNETLKELYLADNRFMPSDGIQLGNMLKYNHHLLLMDIRNNHLQDVGTSHICDGICEQGSGLSTLVLWNNQLTFQAMAAVSRALVTTKTLQTLNLGHNNITNEGVFRLKDGMLRNKSLLRIGMQAVKMSCEGAVAIAEFIADSPRLLRIDLRENDIKTAGLMALSLSFKVSPSLTRLDLDKEPKKESGVKDYAEQQRRLMQDIGMYGQRNRELSRKREEEERQREKLLAEEAESREAEGGGDTGEQGSGKEECVEELVEKEINPVDNLKQNMHLALVTSAATRELTLESPAFVSELALPLTEPPEEATEATPVDDANNEVTLAPEYPLSPVMLLEGKTILMPVLQQPVTVTPSPPESPATCQVSTLQGTPDKSPQTSPNNRRRFVICKVNEHSNGKVRRLAATADPLGAVLQVDDVIAQPTAVPGSSDSVTAAEAVSEDATNSVHILDVNTNRSVTTTDALDKYNTVESVQGLVNSIVDCAIRDVINQCRSVGESGDTAPCRPAGHTHRPLDTGCGDLLQTGDTAANDTDIRTANTQLCENIPTVGTGDSGHVGDDNSGTRDTVSEGPTLVAPRDTDHTQYECPVTDHSSTLAPCAKTTVTSAESELGSPGQGVNESVSSGHSVNEPVSSGQSVNDYVPCAQSVNESVPFGQSVNGSVSSGESVNESVSSGLNVNGSVSSGISVNESVSSGQNVNGSGSSAISVNESVSSGVGESVLSENDLVKCAEPCPVSEVKGEFHSPHPAGCQSCVVDTGNRTDTCSTQVDQCRADKVVSPESIKSDQCHANDVVSPESLKSDQCHTDVVSSESLKSDKWHASETVSVESHQCHTEEVVSSESPKLDQCHAEPDLLNCVAESATSERCSGPAASPGHVTVSPSVDLCHQTEPNLHSSLSMNGMRVELASVLDSLDQQLDPLTTDQDLSSLGDIEQEIEDMLAGVQT